MFDYELYFNRCVVTSYTPNLANNNSYNTITISGKVFGNVDYFDNKINSKQ